jgi:hypothetical protein
MLTPRLIAAAFLLFTAAVAQSRRSRGPDPEPADGATMIRKTASVLAAVDSKTKVASILREVEDPRRSPK